MLSTTRIIWNYCREQPSRRSSNCRETDRVVSHYVEKRSHPSRIQELSIVHLFKRKKDPQVCDNQRAISLLSIVGEILARVLLNRLNEHFEQSKLLPESQCGFGKDKEPTDMIFTARQLQEKWQEQNVNHYLTFVDLTIAFYSASRVGLWKIMTKFGCPAKFIAMARQFQDGMLSQIQTDGNDCKWWIS